MFKWLKRLLKRTEDCAKASPMQRFVAGLTNTPIEQLSDSVIVSQWHYDKLSAAEEIDGNGRITQKHIDVWGAWPTYYRSDRI